MEALKAIRSAVPTFEPVTRDEVKDHLRIARSNEDHHDTIARLIQVAREEFEADTDYVLSTGTYVVKLDNWPCGDCIELPIRPVSAITSITYVDSAGATQTVDSSDYSLNIYEPRYEIQLGYNETWPSTRGWENDITVTMVAGYATASVIPLRAKQACLIKIQSLFEGDPKWVLEKAYDWMVKKFARSTYP